MKELIKVIRELKYGRKPLDGEDRMFASLFSLVIFCVLVLGFWLLGVPKSILIFIYAVGIICIPTFFALIGIDAEYEERRPF